LFELMT